MKESDVMPAIALLALVLSVLWVVASTVIETRRTAQRETAIMDALLDKEFTRVFGCPLRDKGDGCKPR